ncbi:MAG: hypothetical protein OXF02_04850 [Simkaniaceae bacterium]|nr:hypothetical protein [Simkaniaceae bacterium]
MTSAVGAGGQVVIGTGNGPYGGEGISFFASATPTSAVPTPSYLPTPYLMVPASAVPTPPLAVRTLRDNGCPSGVARDFPGQRSVVVLSRLKGKEREHFRTWAVNAVVREPEKNVSDLLPAGVPASMVGRWVGAAYEKEKGTFVIPRDQRRRVDLRKVLKYIREGNVTIPEDWSVFHRRGFAVVRRKRLTLLHKQKAVHYCLQRYPRTYQECAWDIAGNPAIIGGATAHNSSLGKYVREAYEAHRDTKQVPEHMRGELDYRKMLLALGRGERITEFSEYYLRGCKELTPEQEEKVVGYCMKRQSRAYSLCVRDIREDHTILGEANISMNISARMLGVCVQNAYEKHTKTVEVPPDMKLQVDYRKLLRALWEEREVVPFSNFRKVGVVETSDDVGRCVCRVEV